MSTALVVINGTDRHQVTSRIDIGRAANVERNIIGLDERDNGISRLTVTIEQKDDGWLLRNRSSKATLHIITDPARPPFPLRPDERYLIVGSTGIEIRGLIQTHRIDVVVDEPSSTTATDSTSMGVPGATTFLAEISYSEGDRDAMTALFSGYLRPFPRRDPRPLSYSEAGALLGLPASTVRRRIEKIRERLRSVEVYIEGRHAAQHLAELVLEAGIISRKDLARLERET